MPDAPAIHHGLIQKAHRDAKALKYHIRDTGAEFQLWIIGEDGWNYVGRLTSKRFIEAILMDQLGQEEV